MVASDVSFVDHSEHPFSSARGAALADIVQLRDDWPSLTHTWRSGSNDTHTPFDIDLHVRLSDGSLWNGDHSAHGQGSPVFVTVGKSRPRELDWDSTLVIHIRQGNAQEVAASGRMYGHMQPPCAYYLKAIEHGFDNKAFPFVLIVTNRQVPGTLGYGPCADAIEKAHPDKVINMTHFISQFQSEFGLLGFDIYLLSQAVNVAEGHSTFTMGTTILNRNLKRNFLPAAPHTINSIRPMVPNVHGEKVHSRGLYQASGVYQEMMVMDGWLGYNASCMLGNCDRNTLTWLKDLHESGGHNYVNSHGGNLSKLMSEFPRAAVQVASRSSKCPESFTSRLMQSNNRQGYFDKQAMIRSLNSAVTTDPIYHPVCLC